jgi:uncharacterized protein
MITVWIIVLLLFNALWLALTIFGLPGNWLIIASTALFAWWRWNDHLFSIYTLIAITLLAVLAEVLEFFLGLAAAKKAGATRRGAWGALLGALFGGILGTFLILIPILGTLLGSALGAGLGAWVFELSSGKNRAQVARVGVSAGIGRFLGSVAKIALGLLIYLIVAVAAFYP